MVRVPVLHSAASGLEEAGEKPGGEGRVGEIQLVQGLEEWAVVLLVKLADPLRHSWGRSARARAAAARTPTRFSHALRRAVVSCRSLRAHADGG
jgi:hypothetical protein